MIESREESDLTRYGALRAELENLRFQFERAADRHHGLYHQLIHAPEQELPLPVWSAFIEDNRAPDGTWERWDIFPSLTACGRFHGTGSGVEEFLRLAESGYLVLRSIERVAAEGGPMPDSFRLNLPSENGVYGWLRLLYGSARCYATAQLRTKPGFWGHPEAVPTEQIEDLVMQVRPASTDPTVLVPKHPFAESLQHDVFQSSYEAIAFWFGSVQAVTLGDSLCETPVRLPASADTMGGVLDGTLPGPAETTKSCQVAMEGHAPDRPKPVWDAALRELRSGTTVIKKYRQEAVNQETILAAFQEQNWQHRIDDPLPGKPGIDSKQRLRQTVLDLNTPQKNRPILVRFEMDGTGEGLIWDWS